MLALKGCTNPRSILAVACKGMETMLPLKGKKEGERSSNMVGLDDVLAMFQAQMRTIPTKTTL